MNDLRALILDSFNNYDVLQVCLVFISVFSSFGVTGINANLLVIFLESSHFLPGIRELSLLHTFSHVLVNEGYLGVHHVKHILAMAGVELDYLVGRFEAGAGD